MAIPAQLTKKWDPKSQKLMFVGYDEYSNNYRLWDVNTRKIKITCDVNFDEESFFLESGEKFFNHTASVPLSFDFQEGIIDGNNEENNNIEEIQSEEDNVLEQENVPDNENRRVLRDRNNLRPPQYYGPDLFLSLLTPESYDLTQKH